MTSPDDLEATARSYRERAAELEKRAAEARDKNPPLPIDGYLPVIRFERAEIESETEALVVVVDDDDRISNPLFIVPRSEAAHWRSWLRGGKRARLRITLEATP